jgi:hypothetical protein
VHGAVHVSDGSASSVQAKVNAAVDGDVVTIPAGSFTWATQVVIAGKGIKLRGAGGGRIVARSISPMVPGTGTKTFTVITDPKQTVTFTVGEEISVRRLGNKNKWMHGTVTSYSGDKLVLNASLFGGGPDSEKDWIIAKAPLTIIENAVTTDAMLKVTEDATHHVEITGLMTVNYVATGVGFTMIWQGGGKPIHMYDCWHEVGDGTQAIRTNTHQGLVWDCSFSARWIAPATSAMAFQLESMSDPGWTTPPTMGAADTAGTRNFYIENCDFHAFLHNIDADSFARVVVRHCLFNNSGTGSHGADTGPHGMRHVEIYDNVFVFNNHGEFGGAYQTMALNWWIWMRGGTWVVTDNVMPSINSPAWGHKHSNRMTVLNLMRNAGTWMDWGCWGSGHTNGNNLTWGRNPNVVSISASNPAVVTTATPHGMSTGQEVRFAGVTATPSLNESAYVATVTSPTTFTIPVGVTVAGTQSGRAKPVNYPAPRQVGWGHNGTDYVSEPVYIWNNTGDESVIVQDDPAGSECGPYHDLAADYIRPGRDYFVGSPKPGYSKFRYPHPARAGASNTPAPSPPTRLRVIP